MFDKYLNASDIEKIVPATVKGKDSVELVKNYIDNWVRQNLVLHKAEQNLNAEALNASIEKQLEDYKTSLITFAYEKELIRQKLDTGVSEIEIEDYYNKNPQNFARFRRNDLIFLKRQFRLLHLGPFRLDDGLCLTGFRADIQAS